MAASATGSGSGVRPPGSQGAGSSSMNIISPFRGEPPSFFDRTMDGTKEDITETLGKTNHYAGLYFGTALVFMGFFFYDGYRLLSERTFSLLPRFAFWGVVAFVIGTAGEILQKTTRIETPIVPSAIYRSPVTLEERQFPGMPNISSPWNAPTQAIMNDNVYPRVYTEICERARARHIRFKNFLELYPAQSGLLSSFAWPKFLSRKKEAESPLAVVDMKDVFVMLMMCRSSLNYDSPEFARQYPNIYRLIGEFSRAAKETEFPPVDDKDPALRQEFTLMKNDAAIVRFFDLERTRIANKILGFDAYLSLIHAYEIAVSQKMPVVSFGRWVSAPIGNIRHLIQAPGEDSPEDVKNFLHCLSKYVLPGDYPEIFFPLTYGRTWEECPEPEQDPAKLSELLDRHKNPQHAGDILTRIPDNKEIVENPSPAGILVINAFLQERARGQELLDETFKAKKASSGPDDPQKKMSYYLNSSGVVRKYYLVEERIVPPAVAKMPERIILELSRYKWTVVENRRTKEKFDCSVIFPEEIEICGQIYGLKSIVRLSDTHEGGHYDTLVKKQGQWWYASDTTVDKALPADLEQAGKDGYLYFYEKILPRLKLEEMPE